MTDPDPISRRDLLRGRILRALRGRDNEADGPGPPPDVPIMRYPRTADDVERGAPSRSRFRRTIPVLRPPGAVDEPSFLRGCTKCNDCAEACPHDAIAPAPPRFREAAGTPMIDADRQPCLMCADFPCIAACEPDVLSSLVPVAMGTARIVEPACLAHQGTFCSVCVEQCPVEGAIDTIEGRPRVVEDRCTGCGVCRHVCPAPENAVLVMPAFTRPPRPARKPEHG